MKGFGVANARAGVNYSFSPALWLLKELIELAIEFGKRIESLPTYSPDLGSSRNSSYRL